MIKKLVALVVAITCSVGWADDDLLSILGNETASPAGADGKGSTTHWLQSLLPGATAEQRIFLNFATKGEWEKALYQWPAAFDGSSFGRSETGQALNAFVLFKNQLRVVGLEHLLRVENPRAISPLLLKQWREAVPDQDVLWTLINPNLWRSEWTSVWGNAVELRLKARGKYGPQDVEMLTELLKKTSPDTPERARIQWQLVLAMGLKDQAGPAAKILSNLMTAKNNPIPMDLMTITAARLLFQSGYLEPAVRYYQRVSKKSEFYVEAQEELAWTYMRQGQPQNTLAITQSLVHSSFAARTGPEVVFLRSMAQLKVCDYPGVAESLKLYRERFRKKAEVLLAIENEPQTPAIEMAAQKLVGGPVEIESLGKEALLVPRHVTRDDVVRQLVATEHALRNEAKIAGDLYARGLSGSSAQVGFQARLEVFKKSVEARAQAAKSARLNRVRELAGQEKKEIADLLQKMHIVEAEVLQQLTLAERVGKASSTKIVEQKGSTGSQARDKLTFPFEGETWFDEITNYKVDIKKGCQAKAK